MLIHGVVVGEDETPVEWASVLLIDGPIPLPDVAALTDENGGFTFTAPVGGSYRILCRVADREPLEVTVDVTEFDVSVICQLPTRRRA